MHLGERDHIAVLVFDELLGHDVLHAHQPESAVGGDLVDQPLGISLGRLRAGLGACSEQSVGASPHHSFLARGDIELVEHRGNVILDGPG